MTPRLRCRTVLLDAGGVIVLPDRELLAGALSHVGIGIDPGAVPRAHYRAVRTLDARPGTCYSAALFPQLGIIPGQMAEALAAWDRLADRSRSGEIIWSEPTPGALETIAALRRRGLPVVIVTNSDGHAAENLRDCGIADDVAVIDSEVVGAAKPEVRIFEAALARAGEELAALGRAGARATDVVHVGDTLSADVAGARAAGITPIHFDPLRACRAPDHRHIRTLAGLWQHIRPGVWEETLTMS
jgi:putative hydrolase of the HAD superfamily